MRKALLAVLIFLAIFIRFYKLGDIPNGLSTDEADLAYNAYSIIKTGADVYGQKLPLFFQSLDDYKPGLVFYTTIPAVLSFGTSDFAVRIAPFIFGSLTLVLIFLFIRLLYPKTPILAYISATFVAFAPWHIALSRAMVWYIELLFLYLLSFVCFLFAQKENLKTQVRTLALFLSFLSLALSLYVYYAAIIYLPLILIVLFYLYRDFIQKNLKIFLPAILILIIFSLPALTHYLGKESKTRLNAISVLTADITLPQSIREIEQDKLEGFPFAEIIHNRRLVYAAALLDNYFDYFNLDYLFITSKNTRYFYVNNVGLFYLLELPFFLYGLFILGKRRKKADLLLLGLLAIGPIPASLTLGSPFPHRAILTILSVQVISAVGATTFISNILRAKREDTLKTTNLSLSSRFSQALPGRTIILSVFFIYSISVYFFLHQYFVHSPSEFTSEFDNGAWYSSVRGAIPKVNQYKQRYDRVVFTWSSQKLVPAVYFLFYNQVDPKIIQTKAANWTNEPPSYRQIYDQIDHIEFRPISWDQDKNLKNTLFVGYLDEFSGDIRVIDRTYSPNGKVNFLFVGSQ